jgi:hypothetical protein
MGPQAGGAAAAVAVPMTSWATSRQTTISIAFFQIFPFICALLVIKRKWQVLINRSSKATTLGWAKEKPKGLESERKLIDRKKFLRPLGQQMPIFVQETFCYLPRGLFYKF